MLQTVDKGRHRRLATCQLETQQAAGALMLPTRRGAPGMLAQIGVVDVVYGGMCSKRRGDFGPQRPTCVERLSVESSGGEMESEATLPTGAPVADSLAASPVHRRTRLVPMHSTGPGDRSGPAGTSS